MSCDQDSCFNVGISKRWNCSARVLIVEGLYCKRPFQCLASSEIFKLMCCTRSIAEVFCILMIAAEGYEELTRTCRAHLGSLQALEALRRDYKQMETRTVLLEKEVTLLYMLTSLSQSF